MKLLRRRIAGWVALTVTIISCDGTAPIDADPRNQDDSNTVRAGTRTPAATDSDPMGNTQRTRFESRIGPQPWPDDLPDHWPTPKRALVVAATTQQSGHRLLLVNLPGPLAEARATYRSELEASGYQIDPPRSKQSARVLHARRGETEAILTFFDREHAIRLEILFVATSRGSGS